MKEMKKAVVCSDKTEKRKKKIKKTFPTIRRVDIMSGILSPELSQIDRLKLSNLYAEITYMEKKDMKYISEIVVSCQSDLDIYEMLKKIKVKNAKR